MVGTLTYCPEHQNGSPCQTHLTICCQSVELRLSLQETCIWSANELILPPSDLQKLPTILIATVQASDRSEVDFFLSFQRTVNIHQTQSPP